jgi:carbon storage regulator
MLVLLRKPGEKIVINGEMTITILEVTKGQVRIGFDAPRNYQILRQELADEIQAENRTAAGADLGTALDLLNGTAKDAAGGAA